MEAVFLKILNMSLSASVVIAAVLLVRLFLRKAPKKWSYLLWGVVGFRLCCPVSIKSVFSIFSLAPLSPATQTSGIEYIPRDVGMMPRPHVNIGSPQISEAISSSLPAPEPVASVNPLQIWIAIGIILWCIGMAALLVYGFVNYIRMQRRLADAVLVRDNIYETDGIRSPFILGLFQPKIYFPIGLDGDTLRYVLAHEQYHIKRKDYLVKIFAFLLLTVHWFNPLVWLAFCLMGRDMEMSCDEKVLDDENGIAKPYSMALLSFATNRRFPSPSLLAFGEMGVKSRIKNVLNWKRPRTWVTLAAVLVCVIVVAACGTNPAESEETTGGVVQNTYTGILKDIFEEGEDTFIRVGTENGEEIIFTLTETTEMNPLRNLIRGQRLSVRCEEYYPDSDYHPALSVEILDSDNESRSSDQPLPETLDTSTEPLAVHVEADLGDGFPQPVLDWAKEIVSGAIFDLEAATPRDGSDGYRIIDAKITSLAFPQYGASVEWNGTLWTLELPALEYRLLPDHLENVVLAGGIQIDNGWITEHSSRGTPYLLMAHPADSTEWERVTIIWSSTLAGEITTEEIQRQMVDAFRKWGEMQDSIGTIDALTIDALSSDGAAATAAIDRLLNSLMDSPQATLEAIGARQEGIRDWLCWSLVAYVEGMALDTDTPLSVSGLSENGAAARDKIIEYISDKGNPPKDWRQVYRDFFDNELFPRVETGETFYGVALMDFNFDGVPELVVWDQVASGAASGVMYYTDGRQVYHNLGSTFSTNIITRRPSEQPWPLSQIWAFWLVRNKDTGDYFWCVHSGNGQDNHVWGAYTLLFLAPDGEVVSYDSEGTEGMTEAWETFSAKYEIIDIDYSAFTLSIYAGDTIDVQIINVLLNSWRPVI